MIIDENNGNCKKKNVIVVIILLLLLVLLLLFIFNKKRPVFTITILNGQETYFLTTDENGILEEPKEPIKEGYIFQGWYIDNGTNDEKVDFSKPFDKNVTIEARWKKDSAYEEDKEVEKDDLESESDQLEKEEEVETDKEETNKKPTTNKPAASKPQESEKEEVETEKTYSVEWVRVEGTSIDQYNLYIKSSDGEYVNGILEITTIAGTTFEEKVTANGSLNAYIKSSIQSVKIK